jgi:hypothetical protein
MTSRHPEALAENWARALGVSKKRLVAIIKRVVEERHTITGSQPNLVTPGPAGMGRSAQHNGPVPLIALARSK